MKEGDVTKEKPKWLERLEAESWEAELLVSGVAVFGSLQIPGVLQRLIDFTLLTVSEAYLEIFFWLFWYLIIASSVLILNFIIHFVVRAFWIGMIGLVSVFPKGINPESTIYSRHYLQQLIREFPDVNTFNQRLDRIASLVFAFSFGLLMLFISITVLILAGMVVLMLLRIAFPGLDVITVFIVLAGLLMILGGFGAFLNHKSQRDKEWVRRIHFPLFVRGFGKVLQHIFYEPLSYILYILVTNLQLKRVGLAFGLYFVGIFLIAIPILVGSNAALMQREDYFSLDARDDKLSPANYGDQLPEGQTIVRPFIQSQIVEDDFLRLVIPLPRRERNLLEEGCPALRPIDTAPETDQKALRRRLQLACLSDWYYTIRIDGQLVNNVEFLFNDLPDTPGAAVVTFLAIDGLEKGRHLLSITHQWRDEEGEQKVSRIPFWVVK